MDPSLTDPQATVVRNQPEQLNYTAPPTTNPAPNNGHNYPSYPEMISAAIGALKEKDGSSRQAIAKYIDLVYTNLPADNAALLTRHLKCMKQAGQLVMVKHSYALPGSVSIRSQSVPFGNGLNVVSPNPATVSKRRPGRPSKPKVENQLVVPPLVQEAVFVSLGLVDSVEEDEPVDEDELADETMEEPVDEPVDEPVYDPADEPVNELVPLQASAVQPVLVKRGRGRPPKPKPLPSSDQPAPTSQSESKRKPGRPRKIESAARMMARLPKKISKPSGMPRGRPRKYLVLPAPAIIEEEAQGAVDDAGVTPAKRRGRAKGSVLKKARRLSGKPLGRPRKIMLIGGVNQQVQANDDLAKKLEQIQTKIKQVVNVVKPHLDTTTTASACQALQELEHLAWQNLYAPFNIEVQLPVITTVAASPSVLAPSQEPVLVQPPAHFSVPSSVPIADPNVFPVSYQQFQERYQGH